MARCKVEIEPGVPVHKSKIWINGVEISTAVSSVSLDLDPQEPWPVLTLRLMTAELARLSAEETEVWLPTETREALQALGWTPPDGEA